jgi:hypothetical protein
VLISNTKRKLINWLKPSDHSSDENTSFQSKDLVSIPYCHGISSRLTKAATKFNIKVVTSYRNKLGTSMIFRGEQLKSDCLAKHKNLDIFPCSKGVIYKLGLSCGKVYIGESGRCANTRLKEHVNTLNTQAYSNFKLHVQQCKCEIDRNTSSLAAGHNIVGLYPRRIIESIVTEKHDEPHRIISQTSLTPSEGERNFVETFCSHVFLKQ